MKLLETVITDVGDPPRGPLVRPVDIKYLGYIFSNKINVRDKDRNYILCELRDEDKKKPASFCFLLSKQSMMGLVLPFPFEKYSQLRRDERRLARKKAKGQNSKSPGPNREEED